MHGMCIEMKSVNRPSLIVHRTLAFSITFFRNVGIQLPAGAASCPKKNGGIRDVHLKRTLILSQIHASQQIKARLQHW